MKRLLCVAALAALCVPAAAADLPVKAAQAISTSFPIATSGVYYGMYMAGAAGQADVKNIPGLNAASLTTTQGEVGGMFGYRFGSANAMRFIDLEANVGWMNLNGNVAGLSLSGPVAVELGAKVGVPMAAITSLFPNLGLPTFPLPANRSVTSTEAYVGGAARFEDISANFGLPSNQQWAISPALWVGMIQGLDNGTAIDLRFETIWKTNECVGPVAGACATLGQRYMAKVGLLF